MKIVKHALRAEKMTESALRADSTLYPTLTTAVKYLFATPRNKSMHFKSKLIFSQNIVFLRQCENQNTANTVYKTMPSAKV